jgi:type IV pilus assembly protein PilA
MMRSLNRTCRTAPGRNSADGFSLIELLIVVAIILIIAAIAIPNFMRARMAANEAAAVANLRDLTSAAVTYSSTYDNGYPPTLGAMGAALGVTVATCDQANLIDPLMSNGGSGNTATKGGYKYSYAPGTALSTAASGCTTPGLLDFTIVAVPVSIGTTGQRGFFVDPSGVLRYSTDGSAPTVTSPPLK